MIVRKFGGTSIGSVESLTSVVKIIKSCRGKQVVVVSAMSGVTNKLLKATDLALAGKRKAVKKVIADLVVKHAEITEKLIDNSAIVVEVTSYIEDVLQGLSGFFRAIGEIGELSNRSQDTIMAVGERLSSRILAGVLEDRGINSEQLDLEKFIPDKFEIADHSFYSFAEKSFAKNIRQILRRGKVPVLTGYFGYVPGGMLAKVGRGYSDFCASLAAAGLRAKSLEIWTDVSGLYTADPRKIKKAKIVPKVSCEAAAELAHFGAKVIHPQSIHPATRIGIPVWIKNTFEPKARGTEIVRDAKNTKDFFVAVTSKKDQTIVNIASYRMLLQYGFLARIFDTFAKYKIPIDVVATSEVSVSVSIEDTSHLNEIIAELKPVAKINVLRKKAIVCFVTSGIKNQQGVAGKLFSALGQIGVNTEMISVGASEINITFVVNDDEADRAVKALHKKFFE